MKLGMALFLAYLIIFCVCLSWPISHMASSLRTRYLEGVEEPLADQANILAVMVGRQMQAGRFEPETMRELFDEIYIRSLAATIYEIEKNQVDVRVYVTDGEGILLFDSRGEDAPGEDYSEWRDVRMTLQGEYGARTTLADPADPLSSVLYVAAPVMAGGRIAGVLTVAKPTTSINAFMRSARPGILRIAAVATAAGVGLSLLVSLWVSGQIRRLTRYAEEVRRGRRVQLPKLARTELKEMGNAFDKMRESLEGRRYVERYVRTLTHEIKSPVSAIRGAAELLHEEMKPTQRNLFLSNIRSETDRIENLVERMLKLSELETRKSLEPVDSIPIEDLVQGALEGRTGSMTVKNLELILEPGDSLTVRGDSFLLIQALSNLIQNAIDFSPEGGLITIRASRSGDRVALCVEDQGPGIPDYARARVFERFFSLKRPDTGRKSTGLGLNLVREIALLHDGDVRVENRRGAGLRVLLLLHPGPAAPARLRDLEQGAA